jgi:anti-sigma regulatory factor (Ser/Thr protein kinase)
MADHTAAEVVSLDLPCDTEAPAAVRGALADQGRLGWGMGDAMLVASELVTNAVLHSGCSGEDVLHITATLGGGSVRICVEDPGLAGGAATLLQVREFSEAGIGLLIVDQLVARWGAERDGGYRVWAELPLAHA